ncbi:hypothetical protein CHS0354_025832 [Potamilus streckersoni]|uniref:Uncharacterized protein n=1 Tax=Potamilus streckersoni TaxID=2493646 RepID=A0AAE0SU21_9BIVA|nr:hypothetical protein CHS0354_025832 [Potamilus streckersoni]
MNSDNSKKKQRWSKSRGIPENGHHGLSCSREASFSKSPVNDDIARPTPYRLPRISPREGASPVVDASQSEHKDKVWSRYGYEKVIRIPELRPKVKVLIPPQALMQHFRHRNLALPPFKNAVIAPSTRSMPWHVDGESHEARHSFKSSLARLPERDDMPGDHSFEPTPTPIFRGESPAKSVKSIHWMLGSNRYHTFDRQGRSHVQGPYSREFNVRCIAPISWMRMKWGRSRTLIRT